MEFADYLAAIRSDGDRLAAAAELGLDAAVPSCPGWTVADLVGHTGMVHRHKTDTVRDGWVDGQPDPVSPPETGQIDWYRAGLDELLDVLANHDPGTPSWTWDASNQTVGFWYRRMACETVVHRVDAELAHDVVTDLDVALAADATDEVLMVMMEGYPEWASFSFGDRSVRIESTDTGNAWSFRYVTFSGTSPNTGTTFEDEPTFVAADITAPTATIHGASEDLLLFLWGRRAADGLEVVGDAGMLDLLRTVATDVTQ